MLYGAGTIKFRTPIINTRKHILIRRSRFFPVSWENGIKVGYQQALNKFQQQLEVERNLWKTYTEANVLKNRLSIFDWLDQNFATLIDALNNGDYEQAKSMVENLRKQVLSAKKEESNLLQQTQSKVQQSQSSHTGTGYSSAHTSTHTSTHIGGIARTSYSTTSANKSTSSKTTLSSSTQHNTCPTKYQGYTTKTGTVCEPIPSSSYTGSVEPTIFVPHEPVISTTCPVFNPPNPASMASTWEPPYLNPNFNPFQ